MLSYLLFSVSHRAVLSFWTKIKKHSVIYIEPKDNFKKTWRYKHSNVYPTRCKITQFIYIWKLFYMFRVVPPPIIRGAYNCIYSIWYLSHHLRQIPDALDTVVCAPDDGWRYHPKHVEQFSDINKPYNVASCWIHKVHLCTGTEALYRPYGP